MEVTAKMSQTNEQLNKICIEHGVHVIADMHREIVEFWDSIPNDARLAIRGAGKHTVELFNMVKYWEKDIVGIFDDSKYHQNDLPYPILDVAEMDKFDFDAIYFASYHHRFDMMDELRERFPESKYQYLDLYAYFVKEKNRLVGQEFFQEVYFDEMFYATINPQTKMTLEPYYARKYYEQKKAENSPYAQYYLRVLISDYIKVRDFVNAYAYIDEYITKQYKDHIRYERLKYCLEDFLERLKTKVLSRKASDKTIFFILIDGMAYEVFKNRERYKMDFLHEYTDTKGVEFENAYSPGIHTADAMRSIFVRENMMSGKFYDIDIKNDRDNVFYKYIKEKGLKAKNFGIRDLEANRLNIPACNINIMFWNTLCDLAENDEPTFCFIHEGGLFHYPTHCARQKYIPRDWKYNQKPNLNLESSRDDAVKDSAEYLDKSIGFYFGFFPETSPKVIFADHGWTSSIKEAVFNNFKHWNESAIHVPLLVFSKHLRPQKIKEIYSTFYLSDLLDDMLNKTHIFLERKIEFAQSGFTLLYDQAVFDMFKKYFGRCNLVAFKVFTTLEDRYVITYAGQEYYYKLPDERTNLIDAPEYQERIQYIKSKNDMGFPDFRHPKYKETRHLYFDGFDRPTQFFDD